MMNDPNFSSSSSNETPPYSSSQYNHLSYSDDDDDDDVKRESEEQQPEIWSALETARSALQKHAHEYFSETHALQREQMQ